MAKLRAEFGVDPEVFLKSPMLLRQVKGWIDIGGVEYARTSLSKTGVAGAHVNTIIEAALGRKMKDAQDKPTCAS